MSEVQLFKYNAGIIAQFIEEAPRSDGSKGFTQRQIDKAVSIAIAINAMGSQTLSLDNLYGYAKG